ncbi:recombinase family protein [Peribacillus butanolivorans]|uniref:recombinase family protein n=1 Tax=Peribacillus butanolivorans TaxID=421767 RepID=UPI0006A6F18D|nr:recombinase family protein [Peribacillus butanolivorans]
MERPELQRMLEELEEGDMVIIHEISRLSRSTKDLLAIVGTIQSKGAVFNSLTDKWLDLSDDSPISKLLFTIFFRSFTV